MLVVMASAADLQWTTMGLLSVLRCTLLASSTTVMMVCGQEHLPLELQFSKNGEPHEKFLLCHNPSLPSLFYSADKYSGTFLISLTLSDLYISYRIKIESKEVLGADKEPS